MGYLTEAAIGWQPKFARDASTLAISLPDDELDLTGLVAALERQPTSGAPRSYRVAEFTQGADPGQTAVADYLRRSPGRGKAELWVLGASAGQTERLSRAFWQAGAAIHFATADLSAPAEIDLGCGLLRACACDVVVLDARTTTLRADTWTLLRRLLLPGGLVLVRHPDPGSAHPGPGWSKLGTGPHGEVWAAPPGLLDDRAAEAEGPRWVMADQASLGELWAGQSARRIASGFGDSGWLWSGEAQQEMRALRAIDFFCDPGASADRDLLGTQLVTRFLALLRSLAAARRGQACAPCRLTVITRRAALDVRTPREALLWATARALGRELDPAAAVDVRLVDIGGVADLAMLRWLARHDVRERTLAIRKGRLYALRLVRRPPETHADATATAAGVGAEAEADQLSG
jgi:hypothetical protein